MLTNETNQITDFSDPDNRRKIWRKSTTSVAIVSSAKNGKQNVMACEWAMQISVSPPQYLIVIGKRKVTADYILHSREFGLTFLSDQQATQSHVSGSYSARDVDKIDMDIFNFRNGEKIKEKERLKYRKDQK